MSSFFVPNQVFALIARAIRQLKKIKGIQRGREKIKVSLFADDMIGYINYPNNSKGKLLQLINTLSKVVRYKINSQKSVALVYIVDKWTEKETGKQHFTIASNNVQYLELTLTKKVNGKSFAL